MKRRYWIIPALVSTLIISYLFPREVVGLVFRQVEINYRQQWQAIDFPSITRIVIRNGGFEHDVPSMDEQELFTSTAPAELRAFQDAIAITESSTRDSFGESCLCDGYPRIELYVGDHLRHVLSIQHGRKLRWKGFFHLPDRRFHRLVWGCATGETLGRKVEVLPAAASA